MSPSPSVHRHKMALEAKKDFGRQVFSMLPAEVAGDRDRLEWKLSDTGRHVAPAPLAGDYKLLPGWRQKSHDRSIIGETKAKVDLQNRDAPYRHQRSVEPSAVSSPSDQNQLIGENVRTCRF